MASLASTAYTLEDQQRMAAARNYFAWQGRLVTSELGQRVVEVGCGVGNFTGLLLDRKLVIAVDVEPTCIDRLRQRYPNRPNLQTFACDVASARFHDIAKFQSDSCVCLNVLEHIEDDAAALVGMASVLTPGGTIVLLLPAFASLYGPIDRKLGHYRRYSRKSVRDLAAAANLEIRTLRFMNTIGCIGWWTNAHILHREAQSERQINFFDRHLVPIMSKVEDLLPPPFGQSLLVILRKK